MDTHNLLTAAHSAGIGSTACLAVARGQAPLSKQDACTRVLLEHQSAKYSLSQVQVAGLSNMHLPGCLQSALVAMAEALPARLWKESLPGLASRMGCNESSGAFSMVTGVAGASSHKRRLAAIRVLPRTSARCKQLRSAAILRLLPTLMLPPPAKVRLSCQMLASACMRHCCLHQAIWHPMRCGSTTKVLAACHSTTESHYVAAICFLLCTYQMPG